MKTISQIPPVPELESGKYGYSNSWALIIGIDNYKYYPNLKTAVAGAKAFAEKLKKDFNFPEKNIIELYNEEATSNKIEELMEDFFVHNTAKDDRLIIYFGGHGETFTNKVGYICPVNANKDKITSTGISMTNLKDFNSIIPAKHILYIFDSCFSGMAFTRGILENIPDSEKDYYKKLINSNARQAITAGEETELAYDVGPGGKYSPFTYFLLEGLDSKEICDNYNLIRASRLGEYIAKRVSNYTKGKQNPIVERFDESGRGDLIIWKAVELLPFPDLSLQNIRGNMVPLKKFIQVSKEKYKKKYFLIVFWDYNCVPCLRELKYLSEQNLPFDLQVITINTDNPENLKIRTLAENLTVQYKDFLHLFPMDNNQRMKIIADFKITANPLNILVNNDYKIIRSTFGFPINKLEIINFARRFKILKLH